MSRLLCLPLLVVATASFAAPKPHTVVFGKSITVKWLIGPEESRPADLKVRALLLNGQIKEFVTGSPHDITEHLFVVRRAFRLNDSLPDESTPAPRWQWQRGGWLLVDRSSGHITHISLPGYDPYYSAATWYRDYAAYCGLPDDGKKVFAIVAQVGRRQPIVKKALGDPNSEDVPDSACPAPAWQRQPARVTFEPAQGQKFTYAIRGHAATPVAEEENDEEAAK
jgi:hypothetical protein